MIKALEDGGLLCLYMCRYMAYKIINKNTHKHWNQIIIINPIETIDFQIIDKNVNFPKLWN